MIEFNAKNFQKQIRQIPFLSNSQKFVKQVSKSFVNNFAFDMKAKSINAAWKDIHVKSKRNFKPSNSFTVIRSDGTKPAIVALTADTHAGEMPPSERKKRYILNRITGGVRYPAGTWFLRKEYRDKKRQSFTSWQKKRDLVYSGTQFIAGHRALTDNANAQISNSFMRTDKGAWSSDRGNYGKTPKNRLRQFPFVAAKRKKAVYFDNDARDILEKAYKKSAAKKQEFFNEAVQHALKK